MGCIKPIGLRRIFAIFTVMAVLGLGLSLSSCGAAAGVGAVTSNIVGGFAVKGPINNGTINAYVLLASGAKGDLLATTQTGVNGSFVLEIDEYEGPVWLECISGSFIDEATGAETLITPENPITGVIPNYIPDEPLVDVSLTPLTSIAAELARSQIEDGADPAEAAETANEQVGEYFGIEDIITNPPPDLTEISDQEIGEEETNYALVIAGLANVAQDYGVDTMDLIEALVEDFSDGVIDGASEEGEIEVGGQVLSADATSSELADGITSFVESDLNVAGVTEEDASDVIDFADAQTGEVPGPWLDEIDPEVGIPGTQVTLTGRNFTEESIVYFGETEADNIEVVEGEEIEELSKSFQGDETYYPTLICDAPANDWGTVDVTVENADGKSSTIGDGFLYQTDPQVDSITPDIGDVYGGTSVTIAGSGFYPGVAVAIGGTAATGVTFVSPLQITCTTPAHIPGVADVVVTNVDAQTATLVGGYTFRTYPQVISVTADTGNVYGGDGVTIAGFGFYPGAIVVFGGEAATDVVLVDRFTITCTTPAHAPGLAGVTVTNVDAFADTLTDGFTFRTYPQVVSVTPDIGDVYGGTSITIAGSGFYPGATVNIGGGAATNVVFVDQFAITCTTPAHAPDLTDITVTNVDAFADTLTDAFTYRTYTQVASVTADTGDVYGGDSVTIGGSGFYPGATVDIGGEAATDVVYVDHVTITCTTPAHAPGLVDVIVTNIDTFANTLTNGYTFRTYPQVGSVTADTGDVYGGDGVTIAGSGFYPGATVDIGGDAATDVVFVDQFTINCTTPAHAPGLADVTVTNVDAFADTLTDGYTFRTYPQVDSVTADTGDVYGGDGVAIAGSGFYPGAVVTFGGDAATDVVFVDQTTITCTTPEHTLGLADVTVTNVDAFEDTLTDAYTFRTYPDITSVTPDTGDVYGGDSVTISGDGFYSGAVVAFGGDAATDVVFVDRFTITCTTPEHTLGLSDVTVTNVDAFEDTVAGGYTFRTYPEVDSVTADTGDVYGGDSVTITGDGFYPGATVDIGGEDATDVVFVDRFTITCTTPAHAPGLADVTVTNVDAFEDTLTNGYTFRTYPQVDSVTADTGDVYGGDSVTITGDGFYPGATVDMGGEAATDVVFVDRFTITCTTPAHAPGLTDVTVTNVDAFEDTLTDGYTFRTYPDVTLVTPDTGDVYGGDSVAVTGSGFYPGAVVTFGGEAATDVVFVDQFTINCTTPEHALGLADVTATNVDAFEDTLADAYTFRTYPEITSVTPDTGDAYGGETITITGTGFYPGATVDIGGDAATDVVFVDQFTITCTTPEHALGAADVTVTNVDAFEDTLLDGFTYRTYPEITSISPDTGDAYGGDEVTITGTGFYDGATVDIGGEAATDVVFVDPFTITCTTPAHAPGASDVIVTNVDSFADTLTDGYTFRTYPQVTSLDIVVGLLASGDTITITGSGFYPGAVVMFGSEAATDVVVVDQFTITCTAPANSGGIYDVTVTNIDAYEDTETDAYTFWNGIWKVDAGADADGDGYNWGTAFDTLSDAADAASDGDEIWVEAGTYTNGGGITDPVLETPAGTDWYGGFAGTETARASRNSDPSTNGTTIDGADEAYHCVVGATDVTLDGFTLTRGNASVEEPDVMDSMGGGLYCEDATGVTVANCIFSYNDTYHGASGACMRGSSGTFTDCTFDSNTSGYGGGGLSNIYESDVDVTDCTFTSNTAVTGGGGLKYFGSSVGEVTDCTFTSNTAANGGGLWCYDNSPVTATGCTFTSNIVTDKGGGMGNRDSSDSTITNCTFTTNSAGASGGGIFNTYTSDPTISGCTFTGNTAVDNGGGLFNFQESSPTVSDCDFDSNEATDGAGMHSYNDCEPVVSGCTFESNAASNNGGGFYAMGPTFSLTDSDLDGNTAGNQGAGIYVKNGTSGTVDECTVENNVATGNGGGAYVKDNTLTISDSTFSSNTGNNGGGIYASDSILTLSGSTLDSNDAGANGGGLGHDEGTLTATSNTFSNNTAGTKGGGVYVIDLTPAISSCDFDTNSATTNGGGIYVECETATISNCAFDDNSANKGGGLAQAGVFLMQPDDAGFLEGAVVENGGELGGTLTVSDSIFQSNSTTSLHGGGAYIEDCTTTFSECDFYGNAAANRGGGVYSSYATLTMDSCKVVYNEAEGGHGGGICCYGGVPVISNCLVTDNDANTNGGGIYFNDVWVGVIIHCTLVANVCGGKGGNINCSNGTDAVLTNSITWDGSAGVSDNEIKEGGSTLTVSYSTVEGGYDGVAVEDDDPLFTDPNGADDVIGTSDDDYSLQAESPCGGAGSDAAAAAAGIDDDIDGDARPLGDSVDCGCYESVEDEEQQMM